MLELGIVLLVLLGVGFFLLLGLVALVFQLILLPIKLGVVLLKGVLGVSLGLAGIAFVLPVLVIALPLIFLFPLVLPLAIIGLIIYLVRRTKVASA